MKKSLLKSLIAGIAALGFSYSASAAPVPIPSDSVHQKMPRTVITTDGEVDDMNSVIRALLYSNEMDICGIVITSSTYHYAGDPAAGIQPFRWTGTKWIYQYLDDYEKVYPNLIKHDPKFQRADYFRKVTYIGNISNVGEMDKVTEGSEFLKNLFY